jgi:hypothetical protein
MHSDGVTVLFFVGSLRVADLFIFVDLHSFLAFFGISRGLCLDHRFYRHNHIRLFCNNITFNFLFHLAKVKMGLWLN